LGRIGWARWGWHLEWFLPVWIFGILAVLEGLLFLRLALPFLPLSDLLFVRLARHCA